MNDGGGWTLCLKQQMPQTRKNFTSNKCSGQILMRTDEPFGQLRECRTQPTNVHFQQKLQSPNMVSGKDQGMKTVKHA